MYSIPSIVILQCDIHLNFPGQMPVDLLIRASALPEFSTTVMLTRRSAWRESGCRELSSIYEQWSPGLARFGCLSNANNVFGTLYFIETSYILETLLMYFPVKFWGHYKRKSSDS